MINGFFLFQCDVYVFLLFFLINHHIGSNFYVEAVAVNTSRSSSFHVSIYF